ncbi:MAG: glutamine amidotransferase [Nocardioidaceae bacterium]
MRWAATSSSLPCKTKGWDVDHIPNHLATENFPTTPEALDHYDVVILSDIGADTLLLHPDTFVRGQRTPNRLAVIDDWVRSGGGFLMIGGYIVLFRL